MKLDIRTIISIIGCVLVIASILFGCGTVKASLDNVTIAVEKLTVIVDDHTAEMASLNTRIDLNDLDDTYTKRDVSELQDAVKLLATLNSNIEQLLQKDG